jgi:AraC family transcriptional regulator
MVAIVKPQTESFYMAMVRKAVAQITQQLDEALDLGDLARAACLSPFHFHRIFRGIVGETPLELHRRLRMERAAFQLLKGDTSVTRVAFESGFDTHEAFTRAFRALYGKPPTTFRQTLQISGSECARPPQIEVTARSGIHFCPDMASFEFIPFSYGGETMEIQIKDMPELRLASVRHVGPYNCIGQAFQKVGAIAGPAGLYQYPEAAMVAVYHDDPESTQPEELRSDAALAVPKGVEIPKGLTEVRLPAGRYACATHIGPYTGLGDAWARFMGEWLPASGNRVGQGLGYEIYRNNPTNTAPEALRTEMYLPLA